MRRSSSLPFALAVVTVMTASAGAHAAEATAGEEVERDVTPEGEREERKGIETRPFWIDTGVGFERAQLTTFEAVRDDEGDPLTADFVPSVLFGPAVHLGFGVRIPVFMIGLRGGVAFFGDESRLRSVDSLQLYSIDLELGFRVPLGRFEPYVMLGGGYSVFGGLDDAVSGLGDGLDIDGANVRAGLGLDVNLTSTWSIGGRLVGEFMFLARPGVPLRSLLAQESVATIGEARTRLLEGEGSSVGTAFALTVGPTLHF